MAKLTLTTFLTLDGVMQGPGGPSEDTRGGFASGGWVMPHFDDDMGQIMSEVFAKATGFLLGRRTYEIFAGYWPNITDDDDPIAGPLNRLPKYVASTTLETVDWHNSTLLAGDVPEAVARVKKEHEGELQIHGSGVLAQSLMAYDLIDEMRLSVFPVVLGEGKRLFAEGVTPTALHLVDSRTSGSGVQLSTYRPAGRPTFGDAATLER